jgi:hypothetical protein
MEPAKSVRDGNPLQRRWISIHDAIADASCLLPIYARCGVASADDRGLFARAWSARKR